MSLKLIENGLMGIATLSEGETQPLWCKSQQGYFYVEESNDYELTDFCDGINLCEIEASCLIKYFNQGLQIITKYHSLFKEEHCDRFINNKEYFEQGGKIRFYIVNQIGEGNKQSHLKIINTNDNRDHNSLLLTEYVKNGERLRQSILAGVTSVLFENKNGNIVTTIKILDNWGEILMKKNTKVNLEKLINIFEQEIENQCKNGKNKKEAAQIFGIKYEPLIRNNLIDVQSIVDASKYSIDEYELVAAVENGMKISPDVIWESYDAKEKVTLETEFKTWLERKKNSKGEPWALGSISNCMRILKNGFDKFGKFENYDSCYEIVKSSVFEQYRLYVETQEEFEEFNESENRWFAKGLAEYSLFLKDYNFLSVDVYNWDKNNVIKQGINKIFYGVPGCGKSYYIEHEILKKNPRSKLYEGDYSKENIIRTTFYQDYSNTDFVGQILPKIAKGENGEKDVVEYTFNPGPFTLALIQAISNPNKKVALVIEEINRGNAPAIFGDIFQLLDRDENSISEYGIVNVSMMDYLNAYEFVVDGEKNQYSFKEIKIPGNMDIFATMNTSDQNVYTLDTAFVRRWDRERIKNSFDNCSYKGLAVPGMSDYTWKEFGDGINKHIAKHIEDLQINEDKQIGAFFVKESLLITGSAEEFAYKMFDYLWNDVAKLDHGIFFNPYDTLENLIDAYKSNGVGVFKTGIFESKTTVKAVVGEENNE